MRESGPAGWDCVKFLQIIMQDLLRVKVQDKFLVYNKIMAIKQVCIEISRFPDWRYGHDMANTWSRMFWWFFIRSRIQRVYSPILILHFSFFQRMSALDNFKNSANSVFTLHVLVTFPCRAAWLGGLCSLLPSLLSSPPQTINPSLFAHITAFSL